MSNQTHQPSRNSDARKAMLVRRRLEQRARGDQALMRHWLNKLKPETPTYKFTAFPRKRPMRFPPLVLPRMLTPMLLWLQLRMR